MNFYISSRLNNIDKVRYVASRLKGNGWTQTCDWTNFDLSSESIRSIGEKECDGVKAADILIVITPQGRGTHIELGMAIALGKRVYIYHIDDSFFKCDDNTCAFYWLPQVKRLTGEIDTAIEVILRENTSLG
ncbi:MAG: nucleoside 2-deoxyribosyltransferase [Clostridiaceae bacterium]|nr:nucleoside 2-deoxyribosyltransferase [Clostridiaceae bacterium]